MLEQQSEIARLLSNINAEYEAARMGLFGFASGTLRHTFINAKMENMSKLHEELHDLVGDKAMVMIAEVLEHQSAE